ncbi:MAG: GrpB family protein [Thermomicrobiales bacterium]
MRHDRRTHRFVVGAGSRRQTDRRILVVVADCDDGGACSPDLEAAGYVPRISEPVAGPKPLFDGVEPHRVFKGSEIDLNLLVWTRGSPEIQRNRAFRDWLRANDDDRLPYARNTVELGSQTWDNVQQFANARTEVIEDILVRAFAAQRPALR